MITCAALDEGGVVLTARLAAGFWFLCLCFGNFRWCFFPERSKESFRSHYGEQGEICEVKRKWRLTQQVKEEESPRRCQVHHWVLG